YGTVFAGRAKGGPGGDLAYLVWFGSAAVGGPNGHIVRLHTSIYRPASWRLTSKISVAAEDWDDDLRIRVPNGTRLTLYCGQLDPSRENRFTMHYVLDGQDGQIEGRFVTGASESGNSARHRVIFKILSGPTTDVTAGSYFNGLLNYHRKLKVGETCKA